MVIALTNIRLPHLMTVATSKNNSTCSYIVFRIQITRLDSDMNLTMDEKGMALDAW